MIHVSTFWKPSVNPDDFMDFECGSVRIGCGFVERSGCAGIRNG